MAGLNEQRFLILTALANGPRHGYGLIAEIVEITEGATTPRAGALYHALEKLAGAGLVEVDHEQIVEGRARRYYRLTSTGATTLESEAHKRKSAATQALQRLKGSS